MWSPEELKIIQDYQTWLKDESTRTRTLRENGPTGQPWPKRPKCARVLDDVQRNTRQILSGEKLHQYLIQNCAEDEFVTIPPQPRDGYETLEDMKSRLIAEWSIVRKHGRKSLNAYIDFGLLLRQAFALHQTEKDKLGLSFYIETTQHDLTDLLFYSLDDCLQAVRAWQCA